MKTKIIYKYFMIDLTIKINYSFGTDTNFDGYNFQRY